ncbi:cation:dicarboxylate symporter family transporter, partial [Sutterella wadsworthensis]
MSTTPNNDAPTSEALAAKSQQSGISGRMLAIFYLIAIVLGIVNGIWGSSATQSFADFIATMFIRLFKFVAIPIIAVSIISTLSSISKSRSSGRIFRHTIFYTLFTTILAATLAAVLYEVFSPGNVSASISGAAAAPLSSVANAGGAGYLKY